MNLRDAKDLKTGEKLVWVEGQIEVTFMGLETEGTSGRPRTYARVRREDGTYSFRVPVSRLRRPATPRFLGERQRLCLEEMRRYGDRYAPGCGWAWENHSTTVTIMESLVRRGLVTKHEISYKRGRFDRSYTEYRLVK